MDESARIEDLNRRFGIAGVAEVVAGNGDLAKVRVDTAAATAEIYLHGAQVTSWRPEGASEALFLSAHSRWQEGRAIRGGIPVCFPWFRAKAGDPNAPAHGFVRTKEWRLDSITAQEDGSVAVTLSTESDDSTRPWWPCEFKLALAVSIGSALRLELTASNTGVIPLHFEEALHTYFSVGNAKNVRVSGLDRVEYLDNMDGNRKKLQSGDVLFAAATDNAYLNTQSSLELIDPELHRSIRTEKENSATTVVWNPWQQGAAALSDLGGDEWQSMACVEASNILDAAVSLAPGEQHCLRATLRIAPE